MELIVKCPLCNHPIDPLDFSVLCKHCGKVNKHHNILLQCDFCNTDLEKMTCPNCKKEFSIMLLLGNYTYKIKGIEPFNIPPVDNKEAAYFFRRLTGNEKFEFKWDKKPKSMMIYDLVYSENSHSYARGLLLSVSIDLWEYVLGSGKYNTMDGYLKEYAMGEIFIECFEANTPIKIKAHPKLF